MALQQFQNFLGGARTFAGGAELPLDHPWLRH
jgi:hypothetical protein